MSLPSLKVNSIYAAFLSKILEDFPLITTQQQPRWRRAWGYQMDWLKLTPQLYVDNDNDRASLSITISHSDCDVHVRLWWPLQTGGKR